MSKWGIVYATWKEVKCKYETGFLVSRVPHTRNYCWSILRLCQVIQVVVFQLLNYFCCHHLNIKNNFSNIWENFCELKFCLFLTDGNSLSKKSRSSHPEVFCKKVVLKFFLKFTGKRWCRGFFLSKVVSQKNTHLYCKNTINRSLYRKNKCFKNILGNLSPFREVPLQISVPLLILGQGVSLL